MQPHTLSTIHRPNDTIEWQSKYVPVSWHSVELEISKYLQRRNGNKKPMTCSTGAKCQNWFEFDKLSGKCSAVCSLACVTNDTSRCSSTSSRHLYSGSVNGISFRCGASCPPSWKYRKMQLNCQVSAVRDLGIESFTHASTTPMTVKSLRYAQNRIKKKNNKSSISDSLMK